MLCVEENMTDSTNSTTSQALSNENDEKISEYTKSDCIKDISHKGALLGLLIGLPLGIAWRKFHSEE
jgi:hypothetical protein